MKRTFEQIIEDAVREYADIYKKVKVENRADVDANAYEFINIACEPTLAEHYIKIYEELKK